LLVKRGERVPFGAFGASGFGRENGYDVLREYTEARSIWIETSGATRDPFTLETEIINASLVDEQYRPVNPVVELVV
jgi:hypothetical protein